MNILEFWMYYLVLQYVIKKIGFFFFFYDKLQSNPPPKCLHHHQEKLEALELHGQWNKQIHDPWDHCKEKIERNYF